jgi:hypothetical protein
VTTLPNFARLDSRGGCPYALRLGYV